ncbi:MAG: prepilin peptidase [bacterium]|nr:prepilin peptidase [bacterium]
MGFTPTHLFQKENVIIVEAVIVFLFGLLFGSFANVCIYRLPRNESIVFPASHCPACNNLIPWYDNIPVLSFMLLRGKCRSCKQSISWRYPVVELITGILFSALYLKYYFTFYFWLYALVSLALVVITFVDLQEQIIPDELSYGLMVAGTVFSFFNNDLYLQIIFYFPPVLNRLVASYVGLLVGGGILYFIAWISRGGMGGGDIKLAAGLGTFLGWENTLMMLGISFLFGGVVGVVLLLSGKKKRKDPIPFGPFIAAATIVVILFNDQLSSLVMKYFIF